MGNSFTRETPNDNLWTLWSLRQLPQKLLVNNSMQDQAISAPA